MATLKQFLKKSRPVHCGSDANFTPFLCKILSGHRASSHLVGERRSYNASNSRSESRQKLQMFEAMRLSVMRDLETASVSSLDLPFTDMCQSRRREAGNTNRRRRAAPVDIDRGKLYPPTAPKHEEDDAIADLRGAIQ